MRIEADHLTTGEHEGRDKSQAVARGAACAVVIASVLGELVARGYSEPMNRLLRARWGERGKRLGSVIDTAAAQAEKAAAV